MAPYGAMGFSEEQTEELTELLSALWNMQSMASENATYLPMTQEEAAQYDRRSTRIREVNRMLGNTYPSKEA